MYTTSDVGSKIPTNEQEQDIKNRKKEKRNTEDRWQDVNEH